MTWRSPGASLWGCLTNSGLANQWDLNRKPSGFETDAISHCTYWRFVMYNLTWLIDIKINDHRKWAIAFISYWNPYKPAKNMYSQETWKFDKWPHFCIYFFELHPFVALIYIWKYSKLTSVWFLLIWKVPEFRKKTYRFSELIILF